MRWVWFTLGLIARLGAFIAAKAVLILSIAAISLSLSLASFLFSGLSSLMWSAASMLRQPAVATTNQTQRLQDQNRALQSQNERLRQTNTRQAQANRLQNAENRRLSATSTRLQEQLASHRRNTADTARRIGQRAVRTTTRSVGAIPLESVPIIGVSTIIATTAWEIHDACATLDDMAEIQRQFGDEPEATFADTACATVFLQSFRADQYGDMTISDCRAAAEDARDRVFDLAEQARDEVPDLVEDVDRFDEEILRAADDEYAAITEICDCIADLACDPGELAAR